jgi:hypothetical protein
MEGEIRGKAKEIEGSSERLRDRQRVPASVTVHRAGEEQQEQQEQEQDDEEGLT